VNKYWENLLQSTSEAGIDLNRQQLQQLHRFMELLQTWNKLMNLTAITDEAGIIYKHFLDSLLYAKLAKADEAEEVVDLGTGAGFPGLPLKIWLPDCKVVLVDSLQKRLKFIKEVVHTLCLKNVELIHGRAEDLGKDEQHREKYGLVLSRAVAPLPVLVEYCLPLVRVKGRFAAAKGPEVAQELAMAEKAIVILGGLVEKSINYTLPFVNEQRTMVSITKITATPSKYPRKAGQPAKKPLC
jgi:16S rRNA (guanine527-N7)-methyltransferase